MSEQLSPLKTPESLQEGSSGATEALNKCRAEDFPLPEEEGWKNSGDSESIPDTSCRTVNDVFDEILKKEVVALWKDSSKEKEAVEKQKNPEVPEKKEEKPAEKNPEEIFRELENLVASKENLLNDAEKDRESTNSQHSGLESISDTEMDLDDLEDIEKSPKDAGMEIDDDEEFAIELQALKEEEEDNGKDLKEGSDSEEMKENNVSGENAPTELQKAAENDSEKIAKVSEVKEDDPGPLDELLTDEKSQDCQEKMPGDCTEKLPETQIDHSEVSESKQQLDKEQINPSEDTPLEKDLESISSSYSTAQDDSSQKMSQESDLDEEDAKIIDAPFDAEELNPDDKAKEVEMKENKEEMEKENPPEDDDVILIEEDEPPKVETVKETPEEVEKVKEVPPEKLPEVQEKICEEKSEEIGEKPPEISTEVSEEQKEEEKNEDVIEIPEDEPSQEAQPAAEASKETENKEEPTADHPNNLPCEEKEAPSIAEDNNSSMSMDLIESNDIPSDKADTVEDNSTPMDMEVDETANAEWPVKHYRKESTEEVSNKEASKESTDRPKHYDCINLACKSHSGEEFAPAQGFIVSFYSTKKRKKTQYVCTPCYTVAMEKMLDYCNILTAKKPLFHHFPQHTEVVEISDSSEDSSPEDEMVQDMRRPLKEADRELIEKNLDKIITETMQRVNINQQFEWTKHDLEKRCSRLDKSHAEINEEFQKIQRTADSLFRNLNSREKRPTQHELPIHIYTEFPPPEDSFAQVNYRMLKEGTSMTSPYPAQSSIPTNVPPPSTSPVPVSPALQSEVKTGTIYYGMRSSLTKPWSHCEVLDKFTGTVDSDTRYRVKFVRHNQDGILSGKQLAFAEAATQKLSVGCRVVAQFSAARRKLFYPGIVAEPIQETNKFRYLIFFDDGYVQYVFPGDVRRICCVSENVWEDVHPSSRDFIRNYLQENQYQRAVAQVKIGQKIEVERDGKWVSMRVAKVDCSLILVYFAEYTEWIYSGSQRLLPIYRMKMDSRLSTGKKLQTRNEPYVSFRNVVDDSQKETENRMKEAEENCGINRAVAKKSTQTTYPLPVAAQPSQPKQLMNNSTIFLEDDNYPKGKVVFYTAKFNMPPKSYTPHGCNSECLYRISYDLNLYNPLAKPLLSGWERKIYRVKARRSVIYKAPCGRSLRCIEEVHRYLRLTDCNLNVDNYDFDPSVHCLAEYVIDSAIVRKSDISNGVEVMPIGSVNCYDETEPPPCIYANHRIPTEGVHLNLDPEFLIGCDCTDDCMDKSKCLCWQTTAAGVRCLQPNIDINTVGYSYKKLYDPVPTGIYECNSRCKCRMNCLNRVVQHPLSLKLQVFKTANRGWGLRCLNDVPKGQFICIYAGHLLTEQKANEGGQNHGDEYFAELDYIEVAEGIKEGFEPEAPEEDSNSDRDDDEYNPNKRRHGSDSDDDYFSATAAVVQKTIKTRSRTRGSDAHGKTEGDKPKETEEGVISISDDEDERIPQSFVPNISIEKEIIPTNKTRSLRRMFGKREDVYVMDAKIMGNVGRYFNHSCSPNLFVQNVFVDTHDLRFPWVSFFAMSHIRAGTELTWNYNYDVGTVPGKFLFCQCGSKNCRGRIL